MHRTLLALVVGTVLGIGGMRLAGGQGHDKGKVRVTVVSAQDVVEKLQGKDAKVTTVEVVIDPGQSSPPHRHPGPVFGYVLEGRYDWAINDQPVKKLK